MRIPGTQSGFRFHPEDEQIIIYLLDKVSGDALTQTPVFDGNLYDEGEAWKALFAKTGESELWFFTRLRKACSGGGRAERTVGSRATWRSSKDDPIFLPDGRGIQIGSKRSFTYRRSAARKRKTEEAGDNNGFSMTEYRLDGMFECVATDLVLCSVRRKEDRASAADTEIPLPCTTTTTQPRFGGVMSSCY